MNLNINKFLFILLFIFFISGVSAAGSFQVNNLLLKVSTHSGDLVNKTLSINSDVGGDFSFEVVGVRGVRISDSSFTLAKGESRTLSLFFDARDLVPGVYAGSVKIISKSDVSYVPIIFEVESNDVLFDVNLDIPPQYTTISPGDKLLAQVKIYDLTSGGTSEGLGSTKVDIYYTVQGVDGSTISSESETVVVDKQTQITKALSFPKDTKVGDYFFTARAVYRSSVGVSSSLFSISKTNSGIFSLSSLGQSSTLIVISSGILFFFLVLLLIFVYFIRDRDRLLVELKKYNSLEIEKQHRLLLAQQKILENKSGYRAENVKREIDKHMHILKQKHIQRENELNSLKKEGAFDQMQKRLDEWKNEGYNTSGLEYQLKGMNVKEMKQLLAKWKNKYSTEDYKNKK